MENSNTPPLKQKEMPQITQSAITKSENNFPQWFAMRALYRSEMAMKEKLEEGGFKCFVPLCIKKQKKRNKIVRVLAPAISNLIFVFGKKEDIQYFKDKQSKLQYLTKPTDTGKKVPIIIPTKQMEDFIRIHNHGNFEIGSVDDEIRPGTRVRVTSGPFFGLEGTFQRISGHRNKRFVITLDRLAYISTTDIDPNIIEVIEQTSHSTSSIT